jgi:hypothetical protein
MDLMPRSLSAPLDHLLDLAPENLIGALAFSVMLAGILAGLYHLVRRKQADSMAALTAVMIVGNLACMGVAFVAAHAIRDADQFAPPGSANRFYDHSPGSIAAPPRPPFPPAAFRGRRPRPPGPPYWFGPGRGHREKQPAEDQHTDS